MVVRKRGKNWEYDFRYDRKRYRHGGFKVKIEAVHAEREHYAQVVNGINLNKELTLADYFEKWMKTNKYPNVSQKTYKTYITAHNHLKDNSIGNVKLKDLTRNKYQDFINEFSKEHAKDTIRKLNGKVKACLDDAVFEGVMIKNIVHNIKYKPGKKSVKEEAKYINMKDYEAFKKKLKESSSQSSLFLFIMLVTGARYSGVANLKREYIDEINSTIFINENKTDLSPRTLRVPREDLNYIVRGLEKLPSRIDGFLFKLSYNGANKQMARVCDQLGIDKVTSHALRHTHCSYLHAKGVSIEYISKRLGHSNIGTTIEYYQHILTEKFEEEDEKAINILSAM